MKLSAGDYRLAISAPRYKIWASLLSVKAGQHQVMEAVKLLPADGTVVIETKPPAANVTVDGTFFGQTPVSVPLAPDTDHILHLSKEGYKKIERTVRVAAESLRQLDLVLEPLTGTIHFTVTPENAELFINGTPQGPVPRRLTLTAVPQQITVVKEGYEALCPSPCRFAICAPPRPPASLTGQPAGCPRPRPLLKTGRSGDPGAISA